MIRPACWQQTNVLSVLTSKKRRTSSAITSVERRGRPGGGAVDECVEPAEVAADAVDHGARGVFVAEVGAERGGVVAGVG